ncbi:MAG: hypothetical protein P8X73_16320 [Ignavibacteriaceae bacterium]
MKYGLIGASGRLGKEVIDVFAEQKHELVFTFDINGESFEKKPEILIDCSLPEVLEKSVGFVNQFKVPLIIATTGLTDENIQSLKLLAEKKPVVQSYNYSLGIQILLRLTEEANEKLKDWAGFIQKNFCRRYT